MGLRLRDNLHWCVSGGRAVFLDIEADRYFCLPNTLEAAFLRFGAGAALPGDPARLTALVARGLLVDSPGPEPVAAAAAIDAPRRDFLELPAPRARTGDLMRALALEARWAWRLRRQRLREIATQLERRGHAGQAAAATEARLARIVSAWCASGLILPAADRCLVRALALQECCAREGIRARLVFGVRMDPFRAHCWVQRGDQVLVGDFEQVRLFTPIAALG